MRNILIIGGSSSIGGNVKKRFLENGDNVITTYNHSSKKINKGTNDIHLDLKDKKSCLAFVNKISKIKELDVLIILVGILPGLSIEDYSDELLEDTLNINFISNVFLIKNLSPYLKNTSNIVIMSSISAIRGSFDPIYAASKAAQIGLVKSLALWNSDKYKINAIAPSLINKSKMYNDMSAERREFHKEISPSKKLISKKELSQIIFDICAYRNRYSNGEIIQIDGGYLDD